MPIRRRAHRPLALLVGLLAAVLALPTISLAADPASGPAAASLAGPQSAQRDTLLGYAQNTWASFVAMTDPDTGLPADSLASDGTASVQTSTTNIGAYLWSTVVADELGIINHGEAVRRLKRTLTSLETMERHVPSGQYYNWYDHTTGAKLTAWPPTGAPVTPILSSVDNGWLAAALHVVANSVPAVAKRAEALYASMDFGFYYRPGVNRIAGSITPDTGAEWCCYDTIVSESRIASYVGISTGQLPAKEYFGAMRTFPVTWDWQEMKPVGVTQTYLGVDVFEGAYSYDGMRIVPGWGGSMFEALMPALFVPEEQWGARSWAVNHPLTVAAQIHHGLVDAGYGYWGFSPANIPEGGYTEYGVDAIGMRPDGYPSNEDKTFVDYGFPGSSPPRTPQPDPPPSAYTNGVVTPHASFLALRWEPNAVMGNLARLENDFAIYGKWGFRDSVNVQTGRVSDSYLSLDQGIIMAAIGNALARDVLRRAFADRQVKQVLQPLLSIEEFGAAPRELVAELGNP